MIRHSQNIQVFVRCRPLKDNEKRSAVEVLPERNEIKLVERSKRSSAKNFVYDQVFSCDSRQDQVFDAVVRPLIDQVLDGYNCTVFAYGQTGTGHTPWRATGQRWSSHIRQAHRNRCGPVGYVSLSSGRMIPTVVLFLEQSATYSIG